MFYVLTWVIFYMTNHNCRKFKQNQIIFTYVPEPVSYTHLDVYKRQEPGLPLALFRSIFLRTSPNSNSTSQFLINNVGIYPSCHCIDTGHLYNVIQHHLHTLIMLLLIGFNGFNSREANIADGSFCIAACRPSKGRFCEVIQQPINNFLFGTVV